MPKSRIRSSLQTSSAMHGFGFMAGPSPWASHSAPCQSKLALNHCLASACRLQALKWVAQWKRRLYTWQKLNRFKIILR